MLKPDRMVHRSSETHQDETLPCEFGLLCWNVYKQNLSIKFNLYFKELIERYAIDLVAFQEVKIDSNSPSFDHFHFSFAPNIKFFNHVYGVLNGSRIQETKADALLSVYRESMIQTHKSAIFSYYSLHNGESLLLVNLHAINFRTTKVYNKEIETIFDHIRHHQGAMIVAGDFNSWNPKRMHVLMKLTGTLHLRMVELDHGHLIKTFMQHKLDHIFYRGLELKKSYAIDVERFSDHNALYARFATL